MCVRSCIHMCVVCMGENIIIIIIIHATCILSVLILENIILLVPYFERRPFNGNTMLSGRIVDHWHLAPDEW